MADNLFRFKLDDDHEYELSARDFTMSALRHFKQWYGKEYGAYLPFVQMVIQGDCDAVACAIWLAQKNAGEKPREPRLMDYAVADFFTLGAPDDDFVDDDEETETGPLEDPSEPTPDSTPTLTSSEESISSSSQTSAD